MKKIIFLVTLLVSFIGVKAQNIGDSSISDHNGFSLEFTVIDVVDAKCEVTCKSEPSVPTALSIPATASINGVTFNVAKITLYAFQNCINLTSIDIPQSVTVIEEGTFDDCINLTNVNLPDNISKISFRTFNNCSSLTDIEIPESVVYIDSYAFCGCSSITNIELPESIYHIGQEAFNLCTNLTSINIPNNLSLLSAAIFSNCKSLEHIEIPNTITTIHYHAFSYCSSLKKVEIPNSVDTINNNTFQYCTSLRSVILPDSVKYIAFQVFEECTSMEALICYTKDVPHTEENTFYNCNSDMIIYVPEESVESYRNAVPWNNYTIASLMDAPKNLESAVIDETSIELQWDFCGADSYNIYQGNELVANIEDTSYTVEGLISDTEYCFTVSAVRKGVETRISDEVCVKTLGIEAIETSTSALLYPNPACRNTEINLGMTFDKVEVYNTIGVKVAEYSDVDRIEGLETTGVYMLRMTDDNNSYNCRIVIK